ncbi:MAG: alpha/beta fold hydrolase, partial [Candidatus Hydrogenedentes bacterium]|nr:alpha/beta fold hydrolase [Candidatus Hydrogenedentota bacterium]
TADYQLPADIAFTATVDGTEQHYILRLPPDFSDDSPHDLLIALHGHGSDRWQFATDTRGECKGIRDVALEHRMIFVSPDYRAKTSWMGPKAEADVFQLINDLKEQFHIGRVIIAGGSMGGTSALTSAALHPKFIDGVVALNGTANHLEYENFQEAIAASFGGSKQTIPQEYKKRSAEYWPLQFTMPIAISTGGKDTSVPPDSAIRLANVIKRFNKHVLLIHRPKAGHTTNYEDTREALQFVLERLQE